MLSINRCYCYYCYYYYYYYCYYYYYYYYYYEANIKTVTEKDSVTILWDLPIHTDSTIAGNRSDIVLKNEKDKTCLLIDMTIPVDTNNSKVKTTEKLKKY